MPHLPNVAALLLVAAGLLAVQPALEACRGARGGVSRQQSRRRVSRAIQLRTGRRELSARAGDRWRADARAHQSGDRAALRARSRGRGARSGCRAAAAARRAAGVVRARPGRALGKSSRGWHRRVQTRAHRRSARRRRARQYGSAADAEPPVRGSGGAVSYGGRGGAVSRDGDLQPRRRAHAIGQHCRRPEAHAALPDLA